MRLINAIYTSLPCDHWVNYNVETNCYQTLNYFYSVTQH